jgi:DNA-binding MarR family transcriptional regulator
LPRGEISSGKAGGHIELASAKTSFALRLKLYISAYMIALGTQIRHLIALLDGAVQQTYDRIGEDFRPRFFPIVHFLLEQDHSSVGEIAKATGVSQPAATQTINEMRKLGLIETVPGKDRRAHLLALSRRGRELADRLSDTWKAIDRAAAKLEAELPYGLKPVVRDALAALRRQPFADRISAEMGDTK